MSKILKKILTKNQTFSMYEAKRSFKSLKSFFSRSRLSRIVDVAVEPPYGENKPLEIEEVSLTIFNIR